MCCLWYTQTTLHWRVYMSMSPQHEWIVYWTHKQCVFWHSQWLFMYLMHEYYTVILIWTVDAIRHSIVVAGWCVCVCVCVVSLIIVHCTPFVIVHFWHNEDKMYYKFRKLKSFLCIQFLDTVLTITATNFNMTSTKWLCTCNTYMTTNKLITSFCVT